MVKKILIIVSIILVCLVSDQATKNIAKNNLKNNPPVSYLNNMVVLVYAENTGAFLSMGSKLDGIMGNIILIIFPVIVLAGLLVYVFIKLKNLKMIALISLTMIFAGGIGNIIDRIMYNRHVIDFLNFGIGNTLRTGVLNIADMFVFFGAIILFIHFLLEDKAKKSSKKS
jgi:signal peptidase II